MKTCIGLCESGTPFTKLDCTALISPCQHDCWSTACAPAEVAPSADILPSLRVIPGRAPLAREPGIQTCAGTHRTLVPARALRHTPPSFPDFAASRPLVRATSYSH